MRKMTRRKFITDGAIIAGGALGGLSLGKDFFSPPKAFATAINFPESSCQADKHPKKKVLIAYASACGSTGGVAEAIGRDLCDQGAQVDVRLIKNIRDISFYDGLVLGSPIRRSSWLPEALSFVQKNQERMSRIPVAYFLTCLTLYRDTEENRRIVRGYLDPVLKSTPSVQPIDLGLFAGTLDYSKLSLPYRMVMKSKMKKLETPEGDFRNWEAIRAWAKGLRAPFLVSRLLSSYL